MLISNTSYKHGFQPELSFVSRMLDAGIIWLSLFLLRNYFQIESSNQQLYVLPSLLAIIFYFLASESFSLYRSFRLATQSETTKKIILSWGATTLLLFLIALATKTSTEYSRLTMACWFIFCPVGLILGHFCLQSILRRVRSQEKNLRSYAILGDGESSKNLPEKISQLPWTVLRLVGLYDSLPSLLGDLKTQPIDYVFLNYGSHEQSKIISAISALNDSTASIYLIPDLLLSDLLGSRWIMLGNMPLIVINDHPFYGGLWALKKIEDLVLAFLILLLIFPFMLIIALAIRLNSPGPILFKQRRHGLNGEVIKVYKFRTMTSLDDGAVVVQATKEDARITGVGKFLRQYSLDELPQFFNVLQGSMSIVGPRPHALVHNEYYRQLINGYMQRHKVKPGITGWAQVNGLRGETDTIEKMKGRIEFDLHYINHWSIGLDLKIIFLTILSILKGKMAY
jgi:putative colanic acid biosysnthesis UDP-glucose lipid carrier transferase